jgi:hypothetical protein
MAGENLPLGQIQPAARPVGGFIQPARIETASAARPQEMPVPKSIDSIQRAQTPSVNSPNSYLQIAEALAPFSKELSSLFETATKVSAKAEIEAGYYQELQNLQTKSLFSIQKQDELAAANAASTIGAIQKRDPVAGELLAQTNSFRDVGRRRALAQRAGADIESAFEADLRTNPERFTLAPGDPRLAQRKTELANDVFRYYGLTGTEPEAATYVTPKLNEAWDKYTEAQYKGYNVYLEESTKANGVAALGQLIEGLATRGIASANGTVFMPGTNEWITNGAMLVTRELDMQMQLLPPASRKDVLKFFKEQLFGAHGQDPYVARLLQNVKSGDPTVPYEKRPGWAAGGPLEVVELANRGGEARQKSYDLGQQAVEQKLDRLWYEGGPGSLDPTDPKYPQALLKFRNDALSLGYLKPEDYITKRADSADSFRLATNPVDPLDVEDFKVRVRNLPPSKWTSDATTYQEAVKNARILASQFPRSERGKVFSDLVGEIDKARSAAGEFDPGVRDKVNSAVLQDFDSDAVRQIKSKQKGRSGSGGALDQAVAQAMAIPGTSASAAIGRTYQNTKLSAAANQLENLYERAASEGIRAWKDKHVGQQMSPSARSVVISESIANARNSKDYKRIMRELTGVTPGEVGTEVGPRKAGPAEAPLGYPRRSARSIPDREIRKFDSRALMDARWLRTELEALDNGKPVSSELYGMAQRANTSVYRMLLEQLKHYPDLDPGGNARRYLEEKVRRDRANRTVSSNQLLDTRGSGLGMISVGSYDPLRPGGWLMRILTPPAAAATLPPSYSRYGGSFGDEGGGRVTSVVGDRGGLAATVSAGEGGWNSVNYGTTGSASRMALTRMTIGQVEDMQARGKVFAVGAYQFTPGVLARARRDAGLSPNDLMSPENQTKLFWGLAMGGKRPALARYLRGESNDLNAAHQELSMEWAGVAGPSGRGYYDGDSAGNRASVGAARVRQALIAARKQLSGR